ncbi:hypothetical protein PanWU01x14_309660, partial [Parasponia andersonii]
FFLGTNFCTNQTIPAFTHHHGSPILNLTFCTKPHHAKSTIQLHTGLYEPNQSARCGHRSIDPCIMRCIFCTIQLSQTLGIIQDQYHKSNVQMHLDPLLSL